MSILAEASEPNPVRAFSQRDIAPADEVPHYGLSKLIAFISSFELIRVLQSSSPTSPHIVMAKANPGLVKTELGMKNAKGEDLKMRDVEAKYAVKARTWEEGARAVILLGTYPVKRIWANGTEKVPFFDDMKEVDVLPQQVADSDLKRRIWEDTAKMVGL